jgi:hypothetical protein
MASIPAFPDPSITLRDYQDAAYTFNTNNYQNLPKTKRWFSCFFDLNPDALTVVNQSLGTGTNTRINWPTNNIPTLGILVKSIKLPNFKFDVKKNNQYNRWSLAINKVDYEPVEINFWDDTISQMVGFWYGYFSYHNQDVNYSDFTAAQQQGLPIPMQWDQNSGTPQSGYSTIYNSSDNWAGRFGLDTVINGQTEFGRNQPFFRSIRIYEFNRAVDTTIGSTYNEFVLVNPVISSFQHDTLDYESGDFLTGTMQLEYESCLYNAGNLEDDEIASWDLISQLFRDPNPSPLGTPATVGGIFADAASNLIGEIGVSLNLPVGGVTTISAGVSTAAELNTAAQSLQINTGIAVPVVTNTFGVGGLPPITL